MIAYIVGNRAGMSSFDAEFLEPECAAGREFRMSAENSFVNHSRPGARRLPREPGDCLFAGSLPIFGCEDVPT